MEPLRWFRLPGAGGLFYQEMIVGTTLRQYYMSLW